MVGVPMAKKGDTRLKSCSGCLTVSTDLEVCPACDVASHCPTCRADPDGRPLAMHAAECHALKRLRAGEEGLALHFNDLRLLLRCLTYRALEQHDELPPVPAETLGEGEDVDVIVDSFGDFEELMSGVHGGDDGYMSPSAWERTAEVAKQAKFLVSASNRANFEEYCKCLGRNALNCFTITLDPPDATPMDEHDWWSQGVPVAIGSFVSASRFNHSCEPNTRVNFDSTGCLTITTTQAIKEGEELLITYIDTRMERAPRREKLNDCYGFECMCTRCARQAD